MKLETKLYLVAIIAFIIAFVFALFLDAELDNAFMGKIDLLIMGNKAALIITFWCIGALWMRSRINKKCKQEKEEIIEVLRNARERIMDSLGRDDPAPLTVEEINGIIRKEEA